MKTFLLYAAIFYVLCVTVSMLEIQREMLIEIKALRQDVVSVVQDTSNTRREWKDVQGILIRKKILKED